MSHLRVLAALVFALLWITPAVAAPAFTDYAKAPDMEMVRLSPSGERYAYVGMAGGQRKLFVYSVSGDPIRIISLSALKLEDLQWVGDDHLVASFKASVQTIMTDRHYDYTEVFVFNPVTAQSFWVFKLNGEGRVAHAVYGEFGYANIDGRWTGLFGGYGLSGFSIWRVDLDTGVETPLYGKLPEGLQQVGLDAHGRIVAFSRYDYLKSAWTAYSRIDADDRNGAYSGAKLIAQNDNDPLALSQIHTGSRPGTVIYQTVDPAFTTHIFEIGLSPGGKPTELLPGREITGLIDDPQKQVTVGAVLDGQPFSYEFFDPALGANFKMVEKALTGRNPWLVSWSADYGRLVVLTRGAGDSGTYWLIDAMQGRADILGAAHEAIKVEDLNEIRLFPYKAADGLALEGVLTLPKGRSPSKLPLVVLPHSTIPSHDVVAFDWIAQSLASLGYAVFQPNFRGSDGYGEALRVAGYGEWGRKMQTDISDGVAALAAQGLVDPKRACIVGFNYGGYAALAGVTVQQGLYRCVVAVSALTKLDEIAQAWYVSRRSPTAKRWGTYLGLDGPRPADSVLHDLSPADLAHRADAPILLIYGKQDSLVPPSQSILMQEALQASGKSVETTVLPGEGYNLEQESDRIAMLQATAAFLQKYNPPNR